MTKAEFITSLKADNPVVDKVGTPVMVSTNDFGDKHYYVNVRKIKDNRINYENISFVVVKEGLANEAAYYLRTAGVNFQNSQEEGSIATTE
ncbi:MAG TPA: hypothetical protein PLP88_09965 [Bacteroidales bacterium]|nr:hypothetical protein [Bacteroidales bacterium]